MSPVKGWIIIVSEGDAARRFVVVAEPLLNLAKSLVADRLPGAPFVRSQQVPDRLFGFLEMSQGDVAEWPIGPRPWQQKRRTHPAPPMTLGNMRELGVHHGSSRYCLNDASSAHRRGGAGGRRSSYRHYPKLMIVKKAGPGGV